MTGTVLKKERSSSLPKIIWPINWIQQQLGYRVAMPVMELIVFHRPFGDTGYYTCPRCEITLEREFQSFCDRCGQKLDWNDYLNVRIIKR